VGVDPSCVQCNTAPVVELVTVTAVTAVMVSPAGENTGVAAVGVPELL
jgi:hypothetical protein